MAQYNKPPVKTYKRRGTGTDLNKYNMTRTEIVTRFREHCCIIGLDSPSFDECWDEWQKFLAALYEKGLINQKQLEHYKTPKVPHVPEDIAAKIRSLDKTQKLLDELADAASKWKAGEKT